MNTEARDRRTNQSVVVAGTMYSVNGCEPQRVPDDLLDLSEKQIAWTLLKRLLAKDKPQ
jgi:hypothetical protein